MVAVVASAALPAPVEASAMCPPVTIEDFVASQAPDTTQPPDTTTSTTVPPPPCDTPFVYPMLFPLLGGGAIGSPFGAPRDGGNRLHLGTDVFAPQLQPVVAIADGTVTRIGGDEGISGYRVFVRHDDGWTSLYIHLNNDTAGTDDGVGIGIRPDLEEGDRVVAGQVIGWNGDSGNAAGTTWHVHFELHDPDGNPVDPEPSLRAAQGATQPALPEGAASFTGPLADVAWLDDNSQEERVSPLIYLLSKGIPVWCDEWGVLGCPGEPAVATDVAAWMDPIMGRVDARPISEFSELAHASDCFGSLACLVSSSTPLPCDDPDDCPPPTLTEADLARILAWDVLRRRFEHRHAAFESDPIANPDPNAWTPPARPADISRIDAYVTLRNQGVCLTLPDDRRPLTRTEAAQWLVERLVPSFAQCEPPDRTSPASR